MTAGASVTVRVPATSANLGPGFDCLGLALSRYDEVTVEVTDRGLRVEVDGEGADELPRDEQHLVVRALRAAFSRVGGQPPGLRLRCRNSVPQGRGLGSSAAAVVAGLLAARALHPDGVAGLPDPDLLALAAEIEGHPDNVAACLLGGLTLAWAEPNSGVPVRAVRVTPHEGLRPVVFVPDSTQSTAAARALLPDAVPHRDAAWTAGRAALLVHALSADPSLLHPATEDRLHQPYRAAAMPATADLLAQLRTDGVPASISGAGPSVLAWSPLRYGVGEPWWVRYAPTSWTVLPLAVDLAGATVSPRPGTAGTGDDQVGNTPMGEDVVPVAGSV